MDKKDKETLEILAESPLWPSLSPSEKLACLRETEDIMDGAEKVAEDEGDGACRSGRLRNDASANRSAF